MNIISPAEALKPTVDVKAIKPTLEIEHLPPLLVDPKRILLIIPPGTVEESYGRLSGAAGELPMLGLAFIAAALRDQGHIVDVLDCEVDRKPIDDVVTKVREFQPDVVGMTAYITNMKRCSAVAETVKSIDQNIVVILGGPQVSVTPEEGFASPYVDMVVLSEGEVIIRNVMNALGDIEALKNVKGIWFRDNDGQLVKNQREELIVDLDVLPLPALDLFPMDHYYPPHYVRGRKVAHLLTSRGCPFKCTFCETKLTFGRSFRYHSTQFVIRELESRIADGYDSFMLYDDIFTINKPRVIELCEAIIQKGWNIRWLCFTRTNCLSDEMLTLMKKAGCYLMVFGAESGNDDILKLLKKGVTVEKNLEGIQLAKKHGLLTYSSFMLGVPTETPEMSEQSLKFALESGLDYAVFPIFEPYPGTEVWSDLEGNGTFDGSGKYKNNLMTENAKVWIPNGRTREELEALATKAMLKFYLRPRQIYVGLSNLLDSPFSRVFKYFFAGAQYLYQSIVSSSRGGARY